MSNEQVDSSVGISEENARNKPRKAPPWAFEFARQGKGRDVPRTFIQKRPTKANSGVSSRKP